MKFKIILIFISLACSLFSSDAAKIFNPQTNLYQGANFSHVALDGKKNEKIKINQRENDNLIGVSPILLGHLFARITKLENFQKEVQAKEVSREKFISKRVSIEVGLLLKKDTSISYVESIPKKDLESEKTAELFSQVKTLCLRVEELYLKHKSLDEKLSIFSSNLLELVHAVQAEKAKKDIVSKRIEELSILRVTDITTISKKIEEFSTRIAALALEIEINKKSEKLEFFSVGTRSTDSLDSQRDIPNDGETTQVPTAQSTPNLAGD